MANLPKQHTRDNPLLKKIKRERPAKGESEKASFYGSGYIFLSLERTGKNTEGFDQDPDLDDDYKVDPSEHSRFDAVTLHKIGHSVDDNNKFMDGKGSGSTYGGWRKHTVVEVAEAVGAAKGFFDAFALPRALLRAYLAYVLKRIDDPATKMKKTMSVQEVGSAVTNRDELLADPSLAQADTEPTKFLRDGWDSTLVNAAYEDVTRMIKLKDKKQVVAYEALKLILPPSVDESKSAADAADAILTTICINVDVDVDANAPDWNALAKHKAVEVCKSIRLNGGKGLWSRRADPKGAAINGRVYQEAYKDDWNSYEATERKKGVSSYQFRSPSEWFAEVYSAYFLKKLPKAHPMYKWLEDEVEAGK
jgi:hypothetical protein